ncbi:AI-2E family transporter [Donghicola sp. XS_ASV15]|uniref:AI-2E family transporter n=1 Tax=Donghicola sp. XS_ASV15 TaxID=3241295 RepID=UPI003517DC62
MESEVHRIRLLLTGIFLLFAFGTFYFAKDLILPVALGILLTLTMSPVVRAGRRFGIGAPVTAVMVMVSITIAGAFAVYMLAGVVGTWIDDAPEISRELKTRLASVLRSVETVQEASEEVGKMAAPSTEGAETVVLQQPGLLTATIGSLASFGTSLIVGLVLAMLLLASGDLFYSKLIDLYPRLTDKKRTLQVLYSIERGISRYLLSITIINAGLGIAVGLSMWALGLPYPFVWGSFAFALNYLPFMGAMAGTVLIAGFAIITFDSLSYAILIPATYLGLTSLEGQILTPLILGRNMKINTVSVFLSVIVWTWLWGVAGALIAVPILMVFKAICDHLENWQAIGSFLGPRKVAKSQLSG